jgi:hypothetical protein
MRLEKREITLNEEDSLFEMLCLEKMLVESYIEALFFSERKEVKMSLIKGVEEGVQMLLRVQDLTANEKNVLTTI